jgi:putative CocE/NonD family hydrolase
VATGGEVGFFQRWLVENDPEADYWTERGHTHRIAGVKAPILMIGGWYDIFLPWQLDDYAALRAAGAKPYLTIGPWTHGSLGLFQHSAAESIAWFKAHTSDNGARPRELPVRIHVGGVDVWREYPEWPPPGYEPRNWYLQPNGGLGTTPPQGGTTLGGFTYDPADPTPAVGGPRLVGKIAGRRDNQELEARPDVLTFTTAPLTEPVETIGPVTATIHTKAKTPHFDVFVRLCDVDPAGRSWNICDGLTRTHHDGEITVVLWPIAHRFEAGHRIRVQVSGGAHPRFARNPGTGVGLGESGALIRVQREILAPSSIELRTGPMNHRDEPGQG